MIFILLAAFFTGILSKLTDLIEEHGMKLSVWISRVSGIIYGFLIAYVISVSPDLSALWIGNVAGLILTGKIDSLGHYFGMASMLIGLIILGITEINFLYLIVFLVIVVAEELINNKIVDAGKIKNKLFHQVMEFRPLLEITAFIVALYTGKWIIWFGILAFDVAYILMDKLQKKFNF